MSATVNASFTLTPPLSLEGRRSCAWAGFGGVALRCRFGTNPDQVAIAPSPLGEGWGEGETGSSDGKASPCRLG